MSETAVLAQPNTRIFIARRSELKLTKKGIRNIRGPEGELIDRAPGEKVEFRDGRLTIQVGGDVTLADGRTLPASEVLEWLERHPMYGNKEEGFWEFEAPAPEPSTDELTALQNLAIDHNLDGLREMQAAEEQGWARAKLLEILAGTIARVEAAAAPEPDPAD